MTKSQTTILGIGSLILLTAGGLFAEDKVTAQIPFDFSVQNTTLPAGEYAMQRMNLTSGLMSVHNVQTHKTVSVLAPNPMSHRGFNEKNVLLFHRVGDHYFLAGVKTDAFSGSIRPSKTEREVTAEGVGQPMTAVIIPALNAR